MPSAKEATPAVAAASTAERFRTPEEELAYLRERVRLKQEELENNSSSFEKERLAKREVVTYQDTPADHVLHDTYKMPEHSILQEVLRLEPDEHDAQVDELLRMIPERGIKNVLSITRKMGSAHIEDDVHRALVQYVAEGLPTKNLKQGSETWKSLHMTLYEVSLPAQTAGDKNDPTKDLEKLLSLMEQFYLGMLSVVSDGRLKQKNIFTVEIAVQQGSEEAVFYVAVPRRKRELFEKHLNSVFPNALIEEVRGDYNIFNYGGSHAGAYGVLQESPAYPLRDYSEFSHDPLNVMLSAFSNLKKHGEGAAIQFVIGDEGDTYSKQYKKVIDHLREGKKSTKAVKYGTRPFTEALDTFGESFTGALTNKQNDTYKEKTVDQLALDAVSKKIKSRIVPVNIRILASAAEDERAEDIVDNIASTFNQFEDAQGNSIRFEHEKGGRLQTFLQSFTFRTMNFKRIQPLSLAELTALCHLTGQGVSTSRELKQSRSKRVAAPLEVASDTGVVSTPQEEDGTKPPTAVTEGDGIVLGRNSFGGSEKYVRFLAEDRMRHFYEIGQTGTGKTNLMKNMIIQDIKNGEGCCYIDPHGSDIQDILAAIPEDRYDDVIYFDPAYTQRPMGLNMLEYDPAYPEQKTFVVNEMVSIFEKLYGDVPEALGPNFQQYFRNAALLVVEDPATGSTLLDITRVLASTPYRRLKLARCQNPLVVQFWRDIAERAGGEASLENIVPYISSKTDVFLANDIMRPIVAQQESAFNFRKIMDERKILLVNLSKGRLGDINSELLGLVIVGKFLQAALSRVDAVAQGVPNFYLYIDEFQNFTTPSIATILSEARKYRLSLNIAHQFIAQLDDNIRDAVFGNVGTKCVFRVGTEDAEFLEKQLEPEFTANDIAGLDNYNAYLSLLVNGKPARPFNITTLPPEEADATKIEMLKQRSYEEFGRDRAEVEAEIAQKYTT